MRSTKIDTGIVGSEIPTFLHLAFNADGKAEEIAKKNLEWTAINPEETLLPQANFGIGSGVCKDGKGPYAAQTPFGSPKSLDPGFCIETVKSWIFFLTFEQPISYRKIQLKGHGANLPEWHNTKTTNNFSILTIHGELKNILLDVDLVN